LSQYSPSRSELKTITMKGLIVAVTIFALLFVAQAAQVNNDDDDDNFAGRWDDTNCNLVPGSANIYQKRTLGFGIYDDYDNFGSWEATTVYFKGNLCVEGEESYRTTFVGTYQLGGASSLDGFTDVTYRFNSKQMQIFTDDMLDYVNSLPSCSIKEENTEQFVNVRHADCYPLHLVPIENCPILYDIIRKEDTRIWVGNQFPGDGSQWQKPCSAANRPLDYDPFGLATFVSVIGLHQTTFDLQPYIEEFVSSQFVLDNHLGITTLVHEGSSSILFPSFAVLALIQFVLLFV